MPKRRYVDLHIKVSDEGDPPELLVKMAKHLGFSLIALSIESFHKLKALEHLKKLGGDLGLDIAFRLDLKPSNPNDLKFYLRKFRRRIEVIAVYCHNVAIARTAARDRRVDVTFYNPENVLSIFDEGQINLLVESGHYVEVNLSDMLYEPPDRQARILWNYRRVLGNAKKKGIPVIFSSGSSRIIDMRAPRELSAIASIFLGDELLAKNSVSITPMKLVQVNREKLSPNYIQPGVKVVNEW
ncbi:MAG: RNase P subunit p30 family protein [Candidatus Nezhaarchaeales archaeon]